MTPVEITFLAVATWLPVVLVFVSRDPQRWKFFLGYAVALALIWAAPLDAAVALSLGAAVRILALGYAAVALGV